MTDPVRLNLPSASSFALDAACLGRQNLLAEMRAQGSVTVDDPGLRALSERGTRIHKARTTGNTFELQDESELNAYKAWCEYEKRVVEQWMAEKGIAVVPDPILQERLFLHDEALRPVVSGELDILYIAGEHGLLLDGKSGMAYYAGAAASSWQLRVYSILAEAEWPQLSTIRASFIKMEAFGERISTTEYSKSDLKRSREWIYELLWKMKQPDAPLHAGQHCALCPCKAYCHEAITYSQLPSVRGNGQFTIDRVMTMPIDDVAEVYRHRSTVGKIMDAVQARLEALPPSDLAAVGFKMKDGKRLDFIANVNGAVETLMAMGFAADEIHGIMKLPKGDLVKLLGDRLGSNKTKAEAEYDKRMAPFIEKKRGKPTLEEIE